MGRTDLHKESLHRTTMLTDRRILPILTVSSHDLVPYKQDDGYLSSMDSEALERHSWRPILHGATKSRSARSSG